MVRVLSLEFALAFLLFYALYWRLPWRLQNMALLAAGFALLASVHLGFAVLLLGYVSLIWALLRFVVGQPCYLRYVAVRVAVYAAALSPLLLLKYYDFFRLFAQQLLLFLDLSVLLPALPLLLPLGISFYTLQALSYISSVGKRQMAAGEWVDVALFLSFFPVLSAGPICRAEAMVPQFQHKRQAADFAPVMTLLLLALLKKLCIANYLAQFWVDPIFNNPAQYHSLELLCGLYAYSMQIYFDFSGYTDLAMALALALGFKIPHNFNLPYTAVNVKDFWRRWHISLSTWLRDYVYIPLGGNRHGFWHTQAAVLLTMLLSGLWHGAALHFVFWGLLHALAMIWINFFHDKGKALKHRFVAQFLTFHFIVWTWLFFRADTLQQAWDYQRAFWNNALSVPLTLPVFAFLAFGLLLFTAQTLLAQLPHYLERLFSHRHWLWRSAWACAILVAIVLISPPGLPPFIYTQF